LILPKIAESIWDLNSVGDAAVKTAARGDMDHGLGHGVVVAKPIDTVRRGGGGL
jgi:hypothetical protein